ncbi:PTS transporter subunit EIIA [Vibrio sp. SM6]|uniref:PTS transporter subunit EIIA n=1 Tax=Vibrio agarilyticus TaxID=2726741 RepID=A0A7X8TMV1_9VIBR|nr:PTS sugar transporter subunit IIA [Vibrio agarilyticus]NLS11660.1 PTS transporter subunit EIIA [Vibrio agarilyticus]
MKEYQLTFIVADVAANARIAQPLRHLVKSFRSVLLLRNITRDSTVSLAHSLALMQAGLRCGDFCQITARGIDAELACFVLKDVIADHYILVGAKINYQFCDDLATRVPALAIKPQVAWHYAKAQTELSKIECLKGLAQLIYPDASDELLLAFIKREERSPTCVTAGIGLPHVMFAPIERMSIAVISSDTPIDWQSPIGTVHLAIAIVMPIPSSREAIIAATNLTRNLLTGQVADRLLMTRRCVELQALMMHLMSRLL